VHIHIPVSSNGKAFFFLNPILDEAKRSHGFQAATARRICLLGYFVFRFDYFGTGDSGGEVYEMDFHESVEDANYLIRFFCEKYSLRSIYLLGVRMGADLAAMIASKNDMLNVLYLIEPIVSGARYLMEQRFRRKSFFKLNRMSEAEDAVTINDKIFEDHQGFLLSNTALSFISALNTEKIGLKNKTIHLYPVANSVSRKLINNLVKSMSDRNFVNMEEVRCGDFWASLNPVDTSLLTDRITDSLLIC